ncbi:MAG: hypothetical protein P1U40_08005 [Coxiellaceae bacterium]|nr:hypothetical protein [Coxiellaceae bacterium]
MSRHNIEAVLTAYPITTLELDKLGMLEPTKQALHLMFVAAENDKLPARIQQSLLNEPYRAMHRLKSLIELNRDSYTPFASKQENAIDKDTFAQLHALTFQGTKAQLKLLAFVTLADGLKLNPTVAAQLSDDQRRSLPKDSVMWLADVLTKDPLAFTQLIPLITHSGKPASGLISIIQDAFKDFVHYRWAYLAENVAELTVDCMPKIPELLQQFWILNACSFNITHEPGKHGDGIGATLDKDTLNFYTNFTQVLIRAGTVINITANLTDLYLRKAATLTDTALNPEAPATARLICMMHGFNIFNAEQLNTVTQEQILHLESLLPDCPQTATTKITFLPKLILAIKREHPDITPFELLKVTTTFIQSLYTSLPDARVIPLCTLADDKVLTRQLRYINDLDYSDASGLFEIQMPGGFANAMPTAECALALDAAERVALEKQAKATASVGKLTTAMRALSVCFVAAHHKDSLKPSCELTKPKLS